MATYNYVKKVEKVTNCSFLRSNLVSKFYLSPNLGLIWITPNSVIKHLRSKCDPLFLLFLTKMTLVFVDESIIYAISRIKLITDITASRTKRQTSRILEILWWCSAICTKHREKMNLEKQTFFLYFA